MRSAEGNLIPPQLIGGAAGAGFPDLARRNPAGVLSVAEIKPAAEVCLVDGEEQLARNIDQGNARDERQAAWRAGMGVSAVVPILPSVHSPPTFTTGAVTILTAWCSPGLQRPVPVQERERERQRLLTEARQRQVGTAVVATAPTAAAVVAGRALWRHFWRVVAQQFAVRAAVAAVLAAADGPLPFGELADVGLAVVTIIQIGVEWNDLWRQADQLAASEGA